MTLDTRGNLLVPFDDVKAPARVEDILVRHSLEGLASRYCVVAYGANRNPATLTEKFIHARPRRDNKAVAIPAIRAQIRSADVVACRMHGQGYFYGDLLIDETTKHTNVEAWILLLDLEQLQTMHESESVGIGVYSVGVISGVSALGLTSELSAMFYSASATAMVSPLLGSPITFNSIQADNRRLPSMSSMEIVRHAIDAFDIRSQLSQVTGLGEGPELADDLVKYMNGQWWYQFHTEDRALKGYEDVLEIFAERIQNHSMMAGLHQSSRSYLLSPDAALHPSIDLTWGTVRH